MTVKREKGPVSANKMAALLKQLDTVEGRVGFFESARYPDGTPVAYVATIHEFGTDRIPARPFMRPAVSAHGPDWIKSFEQGAKAALTGAYTADQVMDAVVQLAAGGVAQSLTQVTAPALSPVTIKQKKGATKPLVDTGQMFQAITGVVDRA